MENKKSILVNAELLQKLKIKAYINNTTLKDYIEELIRKDLEGDINE